MLCSASTPMTLSSKAVLGSRSPLLARTNAPCRPCIGSKAPRRVVAFREGEEQEKTATQSASQYRFSAGTAYAPEATGLVYKPADPTQRAFTAFTRRREHFVGRCAMLGVVAMWTGEIWSGLGPMGQLSHELHVPLAWAFWATSFLAAGHLIFALNRNSATFSEDNQRDISQRRRGWLGITAIEPDTCERVSSPAQFFLRSELTLGRTAMLIFAAAMLLEFAYGGESPLAYFGVISPSATSIWQAPLWLKAAMAAFAAGGLGCFSLFNNNQDPETY